MFLTSHGLAGVCSNVLRMVSLCIWPVSESLTDDSAMNAFKSCFFIMMIGVVICALCIPAQFILDKNDFAEYYFYSKESQERAAIESRLNHSIVTEESSENSTDSYSRANATNGGLVF